MGVEAAKPRINATHVSLFVAALSLCTAMYQGYLNTQAVGVFSRDVVYRETMRACRDAVEYFNEGKLRIHRIAESKRGSLTEREIADQVFEARRTVWKFAAIATYLANFDQAKLRKRYDALALELDAKIDQAVASIGTPIDLRPMDQKFALLDNDCVKSLH